MVAKSSHFSNMILKIFGFIGEEKFPFLKYFLLGGMGIRIWLSVSRSNKRHGECMK